MTKIAAVGFPNYDTMEQILLRACNDIARTINATIEPIASESESRGVVIRFYELEDHILKMRAEILALTLRLENHSGDR